MEYLYLLSYLNLSRIIDIYMQQVVVFIAHIPPRCVDKESKAKQLSKTNRLY